MAKKSLVFTQQYPPKPKVFDRDWEIRRFLSKKLSPNPQIPVKAWEFRRPAKQLQILLISWLVFMVVGLSLLIQLFLARITCEGQLVNKIEEPTAAQQIWGDRIISQTFVAPRHNLNQIRLMFLTYQRQNTQEVTLRLVELPAEATDPLAGVDIYHYTFPASSLRDHAWQTFTLPTISESLGKRYAILLESPESQDGDAITVGGIEQNLYLPGTAFLNAMPVPADIAFQICFEISAGEKLSQLFKQMADQRPGLWGQPLFYGFGLGLYALLLGFFFWQLLKLGNREG